MNRMLMTTVLCFTLTHGAQANEFSWAGTTDPQTLDPHAVNSAPVLGFLNNVYEGLVRRGKDMAIEPALATSMGSDWRKAKAGVSICGEGVTVSGRR